MRIPYGFTLTSSGTLEINRSEANVVRMIFDFYMAGASLGKVVDMLHAKQISSPTGKAKWTRAAVDHLLSNGKFQGPMRPKLIVKLDILLHAFAVALF